MTSFGLYKKHTCAHKCFEDQKRATMIKTAEGMQHPNGYSLSAVTSGCPIRNREGEHSVKQTLQVSFFSLTHTSCKILQQILFINMNKYTAAAVVVLGLAAHLVQIKHMKKKHSFNYLVVFNVLNTLVWWYTALI